MRKHDTPFEVAARLAKYSPPILGRVLDPSVGTGALLQPFFARLKQKNSKIFCVDSDTSAILEAKKFIGSVIPSNVKYINDDFLSWSQRKHALFDCVVMNPPFAANKEQLCRVRLSHKMNRIVGRDRFMPLEIAFLCHAIDLLRNRGRLLAVLPSSAITSESTQWFRDLLLKIGFVKLVHELPPRSFPTVESRMYLLVFDKGVPQQRVTLLNHDLVHPERLQFSPAKRKAINRLDFAYHRAKKTLGCLVKKRQYGWNSVGDFAVVLRGDVRSPLKAKPVVHTTHFKAGFWRCSHRYDTNITPSSERHIKNGDLLMKRVGRNCYNTLGRPLFLQNMSCSDCVLIIRTKSISTSLELLFSFSTMLQFAWVKPLLERGTGASYISVDSVMNFLIPAKLHECLPGEYAAFLSAQQRHSTSETLTQLRSASHLLGH